MNVKLMNVKDIDGFFNLVESCNGDVFLVSNEGDKINLKSRLSKYFTIANVFAPDVIDSVELVTDNGEDAEKIITFMMNGN